ncbi:sigma-54 dependent transcriptional regulator [Oceanispirochaeta sp.]|jgi:NtrC-family two-component system response regulator AlgB|uniref:sigma-54-dependent transcriptional regulator n=1 Tax=Oceanispirochaeta sp. TaxID=2035350 RepID=UPI002629E685|nr:sigma-54 dependent transcriptional regulator [Oceanispirochaeta sp.]MDA3957597.1 sigma-54 dependent transcriptional regulator [Oceanispirochaeta sp.]
MKSTEKVSLNSDLFFLNILVVDDEANIRKTVSYCLSSLGHEVIAVSNGKDALEVVKKQRIHLAFVDLRLEETNGLELIPEILRESPGIKIVVITAHASIDTAVEAMRVGAVDYVAKPFSADRIKVLARQYTQICFLELENATLKADISEVQPESHWESNNPQYQKTLELLKTAAESEATILLQGESGTGKSLIAREIHKWSSRSAGVCGTISCPSVPAELLESELFGHVRGAFTGAVKDNPGRIRNCEGGTLFLDEIAEMPLPLQAKILRFLQDREYERIGDSRTCRADVRIIAATNGDLAALVEQNLFRKDLFYRLEVISVTLPPLRDRREDIPTLAQTFLNHFSRVNHKQGFTFSSETLNIMQSFSWPGNIRELKNVVERTIILNKPCVIKPDDLPQKMQQPGITDSIDQELLTLAELEEMYINRILKQTSSLKKASLILGIDQATLWRKRKQYNL